MPSELLLHWKRRHPVVRGQRDLASAVGRVYRLHMLPGLEGGEQQRVCGLPEPYVLLRRLTSALLGGHVQPEPGLG